MRLRSMGFNAIQVTLCGYHHASSAPLPQTYVPWNWHCPSPGVCGWTGSRDIEAFVRLAHNLGLFVLLRPGPYICAEWDFGGLPWWLGSSSVLGGGNMTLRSADPVFLHHVDRCAASVIPVLPPTAVLTTHSFWSALFPRITPLLYEQGGPIIAVQLENELGYFGADMGAEQVTAYLEALVALARRHLGPGVLLYTADPPQGIQQGSLEGKAVLRCVKKACAARHASADMTVH